MNERCTCPTGWGHVVADNCPVHDPRPQHTVTDAYGAHVTAQQAERERVRHLDRGYGALGALVDALKRGRCVFWTGNVLVELDADHVPDGPVTMVLDEDDFDSLDWLASK